MNFVVKKCRRVGMADDADSKSVAGNRVRVQVPPPAGKRGCCKMMWTKAGSIILQQPHCCIAGKFCAIIKISGEGRPVYDL